MKHDVSRRIQVIEQSVEDMGCLVSSRCDHLGVIPESGAFWPPLMPPNTLLTGLVRVLKSFTNC